MNDHSQERDASPTHAAPSALDGSSTQERRRLLRAFGAGGALAGAGLPFGAGATTTNRKHCVKNSKNYNATASAVGSLLSSATGSTGPIAGHNCTHYKTSTNWPATCLNGKGRTLSHNNCVNQYYSGTKLRFCDVFEFYSNGGLPPTTASTYRYCWEIFKSYDTSEEAHWLTAICNANKRSPFTYTPAQVVDLYWSKNILGANVAGLNGKALTLFRDYLSDMA